MKEKECNNFAKSQKINFSYKVFEKWIVWNNDEKETFVFYSDTQKIMKGLLVLFQHIVMI